MSVLPEGINFTQVPHYLIEDVMPGLRGSEIKIVLAICRKTFGHQKLKDRIALSQFESLTGMERKTVIDAIGSLVKKEIIFKNTKKTPYQYSINVSNYIDAKPQRQKTNLQAGGGLKTTPQEVQKFHRSGVQKLNPQKKPFKEIERNTTSSSGGLSENITEIIETWNNVFERKMSLDNNRDIEIVKSALDDFSVDEICRAIFNRSEAEYYKAIPWHRDNPEMFFCIPQYIRNDLQRKPEGIFTFEEMTDKVGETPGMTTDYFEMVPEMKDDRDRPLWKLKASNM